MLPEGFKDSVLWKDLMERTSKFPELSGDMEYLLEEVLKEYKPTKLYPIVDFRLRLEDAFHWAGTPHGHGFWWNIERGVLPKEYT